MSKKVTEIDMEQLSFFIDHNIVRMAVADAQYERGHAKPGTRLGKVVHCGFESFHFITWLKQSEFYKCGLKNGKLLLILVVCVNPAEQLIAVDLKFAALATLGLNFEHGERVFDHFNEADLVARRVTVVN
jgi:hypothetical protein